MGSDDIAAITDLLYRYNTAIDVLDVDGWAATFTPDGVFNGAIETFRAHHDKDKFAAHARDLVARGLPRLRHFLSNVRVSVDGDNATSDCFFLIVATPDDEPSSINMVGEYHDRLVRSRNGEWLFAERTVKTDGTAYPR